MTEENEIVASVKTVVNHPIYAAFTKGEIPKLAHKKLELSHIAKLNGLKLENIFKGHAHEFWLCHLDKILSDHRSQHGSTFLPNPLPSGTRVDVAEHLTAKNSKKVHEHFLKLKSKHQKLENEIKSSVKKRI
jgi:hypothetical protein